MEEKTVEKLYHYTDFNAMRGIITNGEIWLWNLRRMNDSQEMEFFVTELKASVRKLISEKDFARMDQVFSVNLRDFEKLSSYASCFSEYADDAAQWARYAKEGMGVCIAFNKEILSKIGEAGHAPLCKVKYSRDCQNLSLTHELADMISSGEEAGSEKMREAFNRLVSSSPLFKHPSFISEKEYRLVSLPYDVNKYLGEPHFHVSDTNIKEYHILKLKQICEGLGIPYTELFEEICIGPQARVTKEVLADYFISSGSEPLAKKIKISECPLRRF